VWHIVLSFALLILLMWILDKVAATLATLIKPQGTRLLYRRLNRIIKGLQVSDDLGSPSTPWISYFQILYYLRKIRPLVYLSLCFGELVLVSFLSL
jgi:hypothetical protein